MPAKIQILSNTNYPLVDVLKAKFLDCSSVRIAVAFLKKSGLDQISEPLDYALSKKGVTVEIIVGLDFKTTDAPALSALRKLKRQIAISVSSVSEIEEEILMSWFFTQKSTCLAMLLSETRNTHQ